ncbi:MAG TPA: TIGR03619 family F420-dependent LLM class oxidoreductase [Acidimicrobiales bacterium]|nr:TIGR03619 family F420-dependent LLM class oxidoreductase [Acidimicrobiales bacterium]
MDFGVVIPTWGPYCRPDVFSELVEAAESLGYGHAWFGDHIVIPDYGVKLSRAEWFEAVACSAFGAGSTRRLRFGFDVLVMPYRSPVYLAQQLATIDALSGGRVTLAVGVGYMRGEFEAVAAPPYEERAAVTEEYVAVLRNLWEGPGPKTFEGRFVTYRDVHAEPRPVQTPSIPVWIGGNIPRARSRAARIGDGWHPLWPSPEDYARYRAEIEAARSAAGRTGPFVFSYSCPETRVLSAGTTPVGRQPYGGAAVPEEFRYAPNVPARDGRPIFQGTAEQLREDVAVLAKAGVDQLSLRFWAGSKDITPDVFISQMQRFANEVIPASGN